MKENYFLLHEKFRETCLKYPQRTAIQSKLTSQASSFTFREIYNLSQRIASFLINEGINKGERVAIILENCPEWISIYFGILFSGGICVPLDPHVKPEEIASFLKDSQAKFLFASSQIADSLSPVIRGMSSIKKLIALSLASESQDFFNFEDIRGLQPVGNKSIPAQIDDIASILYTSGTTALPKGVMLTHKNFSANFIGINKLNLCSKGDVFLSILPLYHAYAFMATLIFPLFSGAKIVFPPSLKAKDLTSCMNEEKATLLVGVPELFFNLHKSILQEINKLPFMMRLILNRILSFNFWSRKIFSINLGKIFFGKIHRQVGYKLRYMISGGARLEPGIAEDLYKLGFNILEGYGLSETSPIVCFNPIRRPKFGSVGKSLSNVEVKIINPDKDGVGEVAIRGANVFQGYYRRKEETVNAIKEGWFYSGDLGFLDKGNYLYLTGRSKEVIVLSSGKNIYPAEIEEYYKKTHVVKELCVLEVKDEEGISGMQAVVVPNFDYFKVAEGGNIFRKIKWEFENISHTLPTYKRITGFILTKDDLPRTSLGKIKRYEVRNKYLKAFSEKQEPSGEEKILSEDDMRLMNSSFAGKVLEFFRNSLSLKQKPSLDDHLELDLGVDSLSKVELIAGLERLFNVSIPDALAQEITNVRQAIIKLMELLSSTERSEVILKEIEPAWKELLLIEPPNEIKNKIELKPSTSNKLFFLIFIKILLAKLRICWRFKTEGKDNIPEEGSFIFCCNHASYMDGLVVAAAMPFKSLLNLYFIGWKQIFEHPALKWSNKMARLVPIDSSAELMSTMQIASFLLRNQKSICIFPEGQRTIDGEIKEFRKGVGILVKELSTTVIPLAIRGTFEAWPRTRRLPKFSPIKVVFGKPITREELLLKIPQDVKADYDGISNLLRSEVERLLKND